MSWDPKYYLNCYYFHFTHGSTNLYMQGGVSSRETMTAYVIIALTEGSYKNNQEVSVEVLSGLFIQFHCAIHHCLASSRASFNLVNTVHKTIFELFPLCRRIYRLLWTKRGFFWKQMLLILKNLLHCQSSLMLWPCLTALLWMVSWPDLNKYRK